MTDPSAIAAPLPLTPARPAPTPRMPAPLAWSVVATAAVIVAGAWPVVYFLGMLLEAPTTIDVWAVVNGLSWMGLMVLLGRSEREIVTHDPRGWMLAVLTQELCITSMLVFFLMVCRAIMATEPWRIFDERYLLETVLFVLGPPTSLVTFVLWRKALWSPECLAWCRVDYAVAARRWGTGWFHLGGLMVLFILLEEAQWYLWSQWSM